MSQTSIFRQPLIQRAIFVLITAIGVLLFLSALNIINTHLPSYWLYVFYAPVWLLTYAFFGGIHGAPGWAMIPSVIIAISSQNALLWLVARKITFQLRKYRET